jgi:hypothetical protein
VLTDEDLWSGGQPERCPACSGRSNPSYEQRLADSSDVLMAVKTNHVLHDAVLDEDEGATSHFSDTPCPLLRTSECQHPGERFIVHAFRKKEVVHFEICSSCHEAFCI